MAYSWPFRHGLKGKVAAELQEKPAEITVECIDLVVIDHRGGPHDPRIWCAGPRVSALLGARHRGIFLRLADKHHALIGGKVAQVFVHHIVLALSLTKPSSAATRLLLIGPIRAAEGIGWPRFAALMVALIAETDRTPIFF